jgi:hypothetical protein
VTRLLRGVLALALLAVAVPAVAAQDPAPAAERDSLEARVRARMGQMLKTQLGLSDEQVRRLQATNQRFAGPRRQLIGEERQVRGDLRRALERGGDTTVVGGLLDRVLDLERRRLALAEEEQRELATFLSPVQRARLFGMEEQLRRRMMEMRQDRQDDGRRPSRRPDGPPPGAPRRSPPA